jgi:L-serine deaminase
MQYQFQTVAKLLDLCDKHGLSISQLTIESEAENGGVSEAAITARMVEYYSLMKESVQRGLLIAERSRQFLYEL